MTQIKNLHKKDTYTSFKDFYPYYLSEHTSKLNRKLHLIGTILSLTVLIFSIISAKLKLILLIPILGYTFAWIGHFFIEKNKPATFKNPFYSLLGDFYMAYDTLTLNIDNKFVHYNINQSL